MNENEQGTRVFGVFFVYFFRAFTIFFSFIMEYLVLEISIQIYTFYSFCSMKNCQEWNKVSGVLKAQYKNRGGWSRFKTDVFNAYLLKTLYKRN